MLMLKRLLNVFSVLAGAMLLLSVSSTSYDLKVLIDERDKSCEAAEFYKTEPQADTGWGVVYRLQCDSPIQVVEILKRDGFTLFLPLGFIALVFSLNYIIFGLVTIWHRTFSSDE